MSCEEMFDRLKSVYEECCTTLVRGEQVTDHCAAELYKLVYDIWTLRDAVAKRKLLEYHDDVCKRYPGLPCHEHVFVYVRRWRAVLEGGRNPPAAPEAAAQTARRSDPVELRIKASFGDPQFETAMQDQVSDLKGMFRVFSNQVRLYLRDQQPEVAVDTDRAVACVDKIAEAYDIAIRALAIPFTEKHPTAQSGDEIAVRNGIRNTHV
jgi:hypothetical protein